MGDLRRRLDVMRGENHFRESHVRHDPIIAQVPVLSPSVRRPVFRRDVSMQGSRIMTILMSQGIQILHAHVGMVSMLIITTSTSHSVKRSIASSLGVDGLQETRILQLLNSRGTTVEARLALAKEMKVFDTKMQKRRRSLAREMTYMLQKIERERKRDIITLNSY